MKHILLLSVMLIPFIATARHGHSCADGHKQRWKKGAKVTTLSPLEDQYDVTHVKLDIAMNNMGTSVAGNATTRGRVTVPGGMTQYAFELNSLLVIDSIRFNNQLVTATTAANGLRTVMLPTLQAQNSSFTAQVYYHGSTPSGTGFFTHGLNYYSLPNGTHITFSLSDQYLAMDWWPSKQSLVDKVDSADLWFTVPDSCKAGSNGRLANVTTLPGNRSRYEWKTSYPIEYYLISVAVAPFTEHSYYMHYTDGSGDSMKVQNYIYDATNFLPTYGPAMDSTGYIIDHFSKLFGRYPFWQEKYGHCLAPLGGGMEHQTMTTLGIFTTPLIAHELGHQWWGDHVTYGSWRDIWLSEGFAAYCEQLFVEHFRGTAEAQTYRTGVYNRVTSATGGSVYVDDTNSVSRVFSSRLTYDKGAAVAHMLRYVAPHDSLYFQLLREYQQQYANGIAYTADLHAMAESIYGIDLDPFFNQWVYGEGYPTITGRWNQAGTTLFVKLNQSASKPAVTPLFSTPVHLRLTSASGDTIVRVHLSAAEHVYVFNWDKAMTGFVIDPNDHILNKAPAVQKDPALSAASIPVKPLRVFPNPAEDRWEVKDVPAGTALRLADAGGRIVWQKEGVSDSVSIPAQQLAAGVYMLSVLTPGQAATQYKLLRQ